LIVCRILKAVVDLLGFVIDQHKAIHKSLKQSVIRTVKIRFAMSVGPSVIQVRRDTAA
jgi:hypothetical protein